MRTDIPQTFLDAIEDGSRWRGHYLVFHWPSGDQGVSDVTGIQYAPGLYCDVLVTEWGTLTDSVDVEAAISGTGSQTRQFTVTLANTSETGWWCSRFADHPPENMEVDLYQTADGAAPVLIGRFVVQSPIEDDETSGVVQLTLLSVNQAADPYVGTLDPVNNKHYPLIIGAMTDVPGTPCGAHPLAKLDGDVAVGATTIKCDRDLAAAGFPASGQVVIDFDAISYTGRSGVNFTGCSGVVKSHSSNQYVFKKGHEYLFAFGAGPVEFAGPLYINAEIYTGQCTIYNSRNPVQVGFIDGYPFVVDSGAKKERVDFDPDEHATLYNDSSIYKDGNRWRLDSLRSPSGGPTSVLDIRLPAPELSGYDRTTPSFAEVRIWVEKEVGGYGRGQAYLGSRFINLIASSGDIVDTGSRTETLNLSTLHVEYYKYITSVSGEDVKIAYIYEGDIYAEYNYVKKGWPRKIHFDLPTLNIGESGGSINPSDLIASLLAKQGLSSCVDSSSFSTCRSWFTSNGYAMAGFMDGGKRCSEAIKDVCWQSRSYLVWDADKVFLRIRYPVSISPVSYSSLAGNRRENSIRRRRQDFTLGAKLLGGTERQDSVINALKVRYQQDIEGNFGARVDVTRQDSIDKIGRAEGIKDAHLVQDAAYAAALADFWIAEICWPQSIISFKAAVKDGLLLLQLGDAVELHTDWSNIGVFKGAVMSLARTLGQAAPEPRANEWEVTIAGVQAAPA